MKTKELIEMLQEADPSGELEVVAPHDGVWSDIYFVEVLEGYYDGAYQVLLHDPELKGKCYSVIGAQYRNDGSKVVLHVESIQDAMIDNPDLPVEVIGDGPERLQKRVDEWREHVNHILAVQLGQEILRKFETRLIEDGHKGEFVCVDLERSEIASVDKEGCRAIEKAKAKENKSYYMAVVGEKSTL
jgi:hypothetical protein